MKNDETSRAGLGVDGLLLVAFIVLKLCHIIEWSWWWVLSPLWLPVAVAVLVLIGMVIWALIDDERDKRRIHKAMRDRANK